MAELKEFTVVAEVTVSIYTTVRARSAAAAKRVAAKRPLTTGIVDRGNSEEEWVTGEELDGTPTNLSVE